MLGWGLRFFLKIVFMKLQIPKVGLGFLEEKKFMQWNTILNVRILGEEYIQWNHTINVTNNETTQHQMLRLGFKKKLFVQWKFIILNIKLRFLEFMQWSYTIHNIHDKLLSKKNICGI
jgi:hypothetical protein